jgi:hypothetical protein
VASVQGQQPIVDNGGPVMHGPIQAILIFWLPPGLHYDTNTNSAAGDAAYESTIASFFNNLSGSSYFSILSQYPGDCGLSNPSQNCFGGISARTIVDTKPYGHTGDLSDPLTDQNIQDELNRLIADPANQLAGFDQMSTEFFVYTAAHIQICTTSGCSFHLNNFDIGGWCAYHEYNGSFVYAVMPQDDSLGIGCHMEVDKSPHGRIPDREIVATSHELFESVSDPQLNAWVNPDGPEIGDNCNQITSHKGNDGSNVILNSNPFVVQDIWSNDDDACVLAASTTVSGDSIETLALTGNDNLDGGSSVSNVLISQNNNTQSLTLKSSSQPGWDNGSTHVRVFSYNLSPPLSLAKDTFDLSSTGGDRWQVQSLDLKVRNANGSIVCEQIGTGSPLATISGTQSFTLATPNCVPAAPTTNFDTVVINIQTGTDDARGDSQIAATMSGQSAGFCLKPSTNAALANSLCPGAGPGATDKNGMNSWGSWSQNNQIFSLSSPQSAASGFGTIDILFAEGDSSCGNFGHEGCDNWDLQGITVAVFDSHSFQQPPPTTILLNMSNPQNGDNCIARFKAPPNATGVRFSLDGTNTHIYINGTSKEIGEPATGCKNNGDNP